MVKKILVTGSNGFIGKHLCGRLKDMDYNVIECDLPKYDITNFINVLPGEFPFVSDCEGIIHLAAISRVSKCYLVPHDACNLNIMGTVNILEAIRCSESKPWLILISTRERLNNLYGITKWACEKIAERYAVDYNLRVMVMKLGDVYGEGDNPDKVFPKLIGKALRGEEFTINDSERTFDFVHVDRIVDEIVETAKHMDTVEYPYYAEKPVTSKGEISLPVLVEVIRGITDIVKSGGYLK